MASLASPAPYGTEKLESSASGVTWSAVIAGAFVTAALSFILMALGAGMGLSSISPWPSAGLSATRAAPIAIVWIGIVQLVSCATGGYLAGRLRTKWVALHTHEIYFRDTAHGFLVWAVGLVISVFFLSSVALSIAKDNSNTRAETRNEYYVDSLFRSERIDVNRNDILFRQEAEGVLAQAVTPQGIQPEDRNYLVEMVVEKTGLSRPQAQVRVDDTLNTYRQVVDTARKAVAHSLYWLFVALLIGAFCGSLAATIGGRERDRVPAVTAV